MSPLVAALVAVTLELAVLVLAAAAQGATGHPLLGKTLAAARSLKQNYLLTLVRFSLLSLAVVEQKVLQPIMLEPMEHPRRSRRLPLWVVAVAVVLALVFLAAPVAVVLEIQTTEPQELLVKVLLVETVTPQLVSRLAAAAALVRLVKVLPVEVRQAVMVAQAFPLQLRVLPLLAVVAVVAVELMALRALVVLAAVATAAPVEMELQTQVVVAAAQIALPQTLATAAQELSFSVTLALNAEQVAQSLLLEATPFTPSHLPALTRHKEKTWRILQKSTTASWNK